MTRAKVDRPVPSGWARTVSKYLGSLPILEFPFATLPTIFAPDRTILKLEQGQRINVFLWCYRERRTNGHLTDFNPSSFLEERAAVLPSVLKRLSKSFQFEGSASPHIKKCFQVLSQFLVFCDSDEHGNGYVRVLDDVEVALAALKKHHTYVRQLMQTQRIARTTAAVRDQIAIRLLGLIHDRTFSDDVQPLGQVSGKGTEPPFERDVAQFLGAIQAIFDSAARLLPILGREQSAAKRVIRLSTASDAVEVEVPESFSDARLMELSCVAFAGLVIADSGANLSVIQRFEMSEDLFSQLETPERLNVNTKEIKLRAGGKPVPVNLTAITVTRFRTYLAIRALLIKTLRCLDIEPLLVQCGYADSTVPPTPKEIRALDAKFLVHLRNKMAVVGCILPGITLRQLRLFKSDHHTRNDGVAVSAAELGHSVATQLKNYGKSEETVAYSEMGGFFEAVVSRVVAAGSEPLTDIPPGRCRSHGCPEPEATNHPVEPDCESPEGCLFCNHFRLHADEVDLRKAISLRYVVRKVEHVSDESPHARRIWLAVADRLDELIDRQQSLMPAETFERVIDDVERRGNLSRYWGIKLQELHLLGVLA